MKNLFVLLFVFSLVYLGCKKDEEGPGEIYGTWMLSESMMDIGNGQGKYVKVKGDLKYVTLDRNGQVSGNAFPNVKRYNILDSIKLEMFDEESVKPIEYGYSISSKTLTLNYVNCTEGCGLRFVRK